MKKLAQKISLALLVTATAGLTTAHAASDGDATALFDSNIHAVIGLAPVISMDCKGVNMGIHRIALNTPYTGVFTVVAPNNTSTASTKSYTVVGLSQAFDSAPETGKCVLTGLIAPDPTDYSMSLNSVDPITFVSGTENDVTNPLAFRTAASAGVNGMTMTFAMANGTPALENTNDLVWRINGAATFNAVAVADKDGFGGYKTQTAARVDVNPAD